MDPVANPYRPGAGRRPPLLAGREALLDAFDVVQRRAELIGEGDRSWVLNGFRGVGKTVLLNELMGRVTSSGWIAAKVPAGRVDFTSRGDESGTCSKHADCNRPTSSTAPPTAVGRF